MRLSEIARRTGCQIEGPAEIEITGVAGMEDASPSDLTFLANPKYLHKVSETKAAAIIVAPGVEISGHPLLRAADPYLAFAFAIEIFHRPAPAEPGVHETAVIAPTAKIGLRASIGPYVVVEDAVRLGDDCVLKSFAVIHRAAEIGHRFLAHSHAVVREGVRIGNDVILQNGAVVGSDGFGFVRQADGSYRKIMQAGAVIVEDGVEIQSNACIDRATVGVTHLRRGVKVDNLVQVGHGCDIGEDSLLCGQAGLAGSSHLGRGVILAGQAGVAGHLTIGDHTVVGSQSGVPHDLAANQVVSGSPAIDNFLWLKCTAAYARLPEIASGVRRIRDYLNKNGAGV